MAGATWNCCRLGAISVDTIQPCHIMQSHIHKVCVCLAVTCHLHFWQNDRDLLHATAVTREWNGYRNKSQHTKLIPEKKIKRGRRDQNHLYSYSMKAQVCNSVERWWWGATWMSLAADFWTVWRRWMTKLAHPRGSRLGQICENGLK